MKIDLPLSVTFQALSPIKQSKICGDPPFGISAMYNDLMFQEQKFSIVMRTTHILLLAGLSCGLVSPAWTQDTGSTGKKWYGGNTPLSDRAGLIAKQEKSAGQRSIRRLGNEALIQAIPARCQRLMHQFEQLVQRQNAVLASGNWTEAQVVEISTNFGLAQSGLTAMIERCQSRSLADKTTISSDLPAKRPSLRP